MKIFFVIFYLAISQCSSIPVEESVVSVYTTQTTTSGTAVPLDVYHQIANNIAERITSPIYRLFGINSTTSTEAPKKGIDTLELSDDSDLGKKYDIKPVNNDILQDRDVEELSVEALQKTDKKPEKITLFSTYLPVLKDNLAVKPNNVTETTTGFDDFDPFKDEDDDENEMPREGGFVYFLELFGSLIQLVWGGLTSLFRPSSNSR